MPNLTIVSDIDKRILLFRSSYTDIFSIVLFGIQCLKLPFNYNVKDIILLIVQVLLHPIIYVYQNSNHYTYQPTAHRSDEVLCK